MADNLQIDPSWAPDAAQSEIDFSESSFFKFNGPNSQLPSPAEVRALSGESETHPQPAPVKFTHLGLLVKFGYNVTVYEAQCLSVMKRVLRYEVAVPEVYGWRVDNNQVFIYMQLIQGPTLKERWDSLNVSDKTAVCDQLRRIVTCLRRVKQEPHESLIGSITRRALPDYIFEGRPECGPFTSIKLFHDWLSKLPASLIPDCPEYEDPWRTFLPDNGDIKLTHGDLHRGNIIVSLTSPPQILAIVDWAQAGWYPDYWEYCKFCFSACYNGEWRNQWIPKFLDPRTEENEVFGEYVMAIGAV